MKTIRFLSLYILVLATFGCNEIKTEDPAKNKPPMTWQDGTTETVMEVDGQALKTTIEFISDCWYNIKVNENWLSAVPSGENAILVNIKENLENKPRSAIISLEPKKEGKTITLTVNQSIYLDRYVLTKFYETMDGPNWLKNTNWCTSEPLDSWEGIRTIKGRVTEIDLISNHLTGKIPEEIYELTELEVLALSNFELLNTLDNDYKGYWNHITGDISPSVGKLSKLKEFRLAGNALTGSLPKEIWSDHLKYLDCENRSLSFLTCI